MDANDRMTVDPAKVEAYLQEMRTIRRERFGRWMLKHLVFQLLFVIALVVIAILVSENLRRLVFTERRLPIALMLLVVAIGLLPAAWRVWRADRRDPALMTRDIEKEWNAMAGPRWPRRVVLMSLVLAIGFGTILSAFIPFLPASQLIGGSVLRTALFNYGASLAFAIPCAFLLRWVVLRSYRRFLSAKPS